MDSARHVIKRILTGVERHPMTWRRHVITRILNPRFSSHFTFCDVASTIHESLDGGKQPAEAAEDKRQGGQGRAVQVHPIKPTLKPPGTERLKLKHDQPLSNLTLKLKLRRFTKVAAQQQKVPPLPFLLSSLIQSRKPRKVGRCRFTPC
jgi:hypothetical protein